MYYTLITLFKNKVTKNVLVDFIELMFYNIQYKEHLFVNNILQ